MLNTSSGLQGIVESIVNVFNTILPVLTALCLVFFFIGIIKYIYHEGGQKKGPAILWSLLALFVLLSLWGILRIMCNTLTGGGSCKANSGYNANSSNGSGQGFNVLPPIY
jgi:ABC-type proline/glycine betaine transport system permease subunit